MGYIFFSHPLFKEQISQVILDSFISVYRPV